MLATTLASGAWLADADSRTDGTPPGGRGTNILVVGHDSRTGLSAAEKRRLHVGGKGCNCTDVMMLLHLSQDGRRASVVSLPRDSYVEYANGTGRRGKINGAYALGGGALTVKTVEKVTGLHIDHYLETGFTGFEQAVDNLGGAVVCTDKPLKDENSGLDITAGVHQTNGNNTLRYVRARHINRPGDLGRVRRQQRVVADLLARLVSRDALSGPVNTARTARALLKSVRTDAGTDLLDLVRIGRTLGALRANQAEFATVPIREFDHRVPGVGSTLLWHEARSAALWAALAADRPIKGDPRIQPVPETAPPPTRRGSRCASTTRTWPRRCARTSSRSRTPRRPRRPSAPPARRSSGTHPAWRSTRPRWPRPCPAHGWWPSPVTTRPSRSPSAPGPSG